MLIIGPKLFFQFWPSCPNQPRIDFSYYKYVPRLICLLICGLNCPTDPNKPKSQILFRKKDTPQDFFIRNLFLTVTASFYGMLSSLKILFLGINYYWKIFAHCLRAAGGLDGFWDYISSWALKVLQKWAQIKSGLFPFFKASIYNNGCFWEFLSINYWRQISIFRKKWKHQGVNF